MFNPAVMEQIIEDERLTEGLGEDDAQELVGWMLGMAEELEEAPQHLQLLFRLGYSIAAMVRRYGIPSEDLIDLVELAWEDLPLPPSMKA